MTEQHPITPPDELVLQWVGKYFGCTVSGELSDLEKHIADQASQWGWQQRDATVPQELQEAANQELDACCEWLAQETPEPYINALRAARRSKPPTLKEQAINLLQTYGTSGVLLKEDRLDVIRRALKSLSEQ